MKHIWLLKEFARGTYKQIFLYVRLISGDVGNIILLRFNDRLVESLHPSDTLRMACRRDQVGHAENPAYMLKELRRWLQPDIVYMPFQWSIHEQQAGHESLLYRAQQYILELNGLD